MNQFRVDDRFSTALRAELVARVRESSPLPTRRHARAWLGGGALAGVCLLGGIGATASGWLYIPGGQEVNPLASPVTKSYTGTATVELGEPPAGTTDIEVKLTALSAGRYELPNGASCGFTDNDLRTEDGASCGYMLPIEPGQKSVVIQAEPGSSWRLTAKYVKQVRTGLAVNARGETYGIESPENGVPDLIAVTATNGSAGYVYAKDLYGGPTPTSPEDAAKNFSTPRPSRELPVFLSDGETNVGVFLASGSGGGMPTHLPSAPGQ